MCKIYYETFRERIKGSDQGETERNKHRKREEKMEKKKAKETGQALPGAAAASPGCPTQASGDTSTACLCIAPGAGIPQQPERMDRMRALCSMHTQVPFVFVCQ